MAETLLIIDDDVRLAEMVGRYLAAAGYGVEARHTGRAGLEAATGAGRFDAVILDVMLPDMDGLEVYRRLRAQTDVPILMLTARGEETDRIVGLELGADDYLPKPFNPRELQARLKAILRRPRDPDGSVLRFGRLEIDGGSRSIRVDGRERSVTSHQFDLLLALARHAGRVMSRARLMDLVKGEELEAFRSLDRCPRLASARRHRGHPRPSPPDHHRARGRLCVRQGPGPGLTCARGFSAACSGRSI